MLNIDIFDDFISVKARTGISKYGTAILGEDFSRGMSGYDIEDMVKLVLSKNEYHLELLQNFTFDSEYSMFCMYYKIDGKTSGKVTEEAIKLCTELVTIFNNAIKQEYINQVTRELDTIPQIWYSERYKP
jgi:hypothetical protein